MARTAQARLAICLLLAGVSTACGEVPEEKELPVSVQGEQRQSMDAVNAASTSKATLTMGEDSFEFDSVTCIGTSMATAIAADRADRDNYPTVTLKTFDPAFTGGVDSNTASVQFRGSERNELWVLDEGNVSRSDTGFQASGTITGNRMVTQADGTLKPHPLEDSSVLPFVVDIDCR